MHTAVPGHTTRRVDQLLAHDSASHRHPTNKLIHFMAIPLIMLSLVGLLCEMHPWAAYVFVAARMVYYLRLSRVFFTTMLLGSALLHTQVQGKG